MLYTQSIILFLSFLFGFISKLADLLNEHGLKWFKYSDAIFGFVWGAVGSVIVILNGNIAIVYVATVLYWFLKIKLEHFNHALAGVMVILTFIWTSEIRTIEWKYVFLLFLWLTISGYINTFLKNRYKNNRLLIQFLRLRLRYYLGPLVLSLFINDLLPFFSVIAGMLGTELLTIWFIKYQKSGKSNLEKYLKIRLERR